jgi:DNA-binding PadR family transcriptional regulator
MAMYEFIILSQLMHGPAHGYLIAKIINDMIGPSARISYGRLYPLLAKLEQNGLIAAERAAASGQQGDRQLRIYTITEAGRVRFKVLMSDTGSSPGEYQKLFAYKVTAFGFITPAERLRLIDHYINYCQAHVFHLQTEAEVQVRQVGMVEDMAREAPEMAHAIPQVDSYSIETIVNVIQHTIEEWQLELEWARSLREREVTLAAKAGTQMPDAAVTERVEK